MDISRQLSGTNNENMSKFENLKVWNEARSLSIEVYGIMNENRDYGFRDQLQRAAISIMNNIAEGSDSGSDALFVRYLNIAKGSCAEVRSMLYVCKDLGYISESQSDSIIAQTRSISAGLVKLINFLERRNDE